MDDEETTDSNIRPIATEDEFQEGLQQLVVEADSNGVDVRGGWPVEGSDGERAWDIEITRVSKRSVATIEDTDAPASAIVEAVAEREGVDTTELPPLYDAIGPDILEVFHDADADANQRVTFEYHRYSVTVSSDGLVVLDG
jgi:hypothetical protein